MQTFLPYPDFAQSAACLDNRRLGKQRVECLQILRALRDPSYGWQNHPAVRMWRNKQHALALYGCHVCYEWRKRGFKDTCTEKICSLMLWTNDLEIELRAIQFNEQYPLYDYPLWLDNPAFHASHRSNLLRKDPAFYGRYGWTEPHNLPYVWPV